MGEITILLIYPSYKNALPFSDTHIKLLIQVIKMKKILFLKIVTVISSISMQAYGNSKPTCDNPVGIWSNPQGQTITITKLDQNSGQLHGTFQLPAAIDNTPYGLTGWTNNLGTSKPKTDEDTAISFSVRWEGLTSISSWIGTCSNTQGLSKLNLINHQVRLNAQQKNERISVSFDTFTAK